MAVLRLLRGIRQSAGSGEVRLPSRLRDDFLSAAELSFYRVLRAAVGERAVVLAKVNLADLFDVTWSEGRQARRNRVNQKHVDFLLCHSETLRPLAGVELDDASHQRARRVERDEFVERVFAAAGLPLIRVPARPAYEPQALLAELEPHLAGRTVSGIPSSGRNASGSAVPVCPKCDVPMVRRVAGKGRRAGKAFWGCVHYPRCRETA